MRVPLVGQNIGKSYVSEHREVDKSTTSRYQIPMFCSLFHGKSERDANVRPTVVFGARALENPRAIYREHHARVQGQRKSVWGVLEGVLGLFSRT